MCEKQSLLSKYLDFYNGKRTGVNLTAINLGAKQDRNVRRKKSNRCKRFKGPMPKIDVVVACERVFRVGTKISQQATTSCTVQPFLFLALLNESQGSPAQ